MTTRNTILPLLFLAVCGGDLSLGRDVLRIGPPVWTGVIEDIDPSRAPHSAVALSPDGTALAYVQGAPWPRVFLRLLGEDDADRMLGAVLPFGREPFRFSPDGEWVYFTAVDRRAPRPAAASGPVRTHVVRAHVSDGKLEFVYPKRMAAGSTSAVFFDVAPDGVRVLVGRSRGALEQSSAASVSLEVAEIQVRDDPMPTPLGFRVPLHAGGARYAADGESAEHASERGREDGQLLLFHDGESTLLDGLVAGEQLAAGRLTLMRRLVPHLGSFGRDGVFEYRARAIGASASAVSVVRFDATYGSGDRDLPQPVFFTSDRVLLRAAGADPRTHLVAQYTHETVEGSAPAQAFAKAEALLLPDAFRDGDLLARADGDARPVLEEAAASLRVARETRTPVALAATLIEQRVDHGEAGEGSSALPRRLEVVEVFPGKLRIERFREVEVEGPASPGVEGPLTVTRSEVFAFDGRRCWFKSEDEESDAIAPEELVIELNSASLYRLLLDPVGLRDPRVRFEGLETLRAEEGEDERLAISFSYDDGFGGRVVLARRDGLLLPVTIETPHVSAGRPAPDEGSAAGSTKRLGFGGWEAWEGHRIPTTLLFDNGEEDRLLGVLGLREVAEPDDSVFDDPSS